MKSNQVFALAVVSAGMASCVSGFADGAAVQPTGIMATLAGLASAHIPALASTLAVFAVDMWHRYRPSDRPAGVLYFIRDAAIYVAKGLNTAAVFADGVLKQNSTEKYNPPPTV